MTSTASPPQALRHPFRWQALFVLCVLGHLVVLYLPGSAASAVDVPPGTDKLVHVVVFGTVAWSGLRAGLPAVPLLGVLLVHAPLSELVQAPLVTGRSGDVRDVVADVVGVLIGALAARSATGPPAPSSHSATSVSDTPARR